MGKGHGEGRGCWSGERVGGTVGGNALRVSYIEVVGNGNAAPTWLRVGSWEQRDNGVQCTHVSG